MRTPYLVWDPKTSKEADGIEVLAYSFAQAAERFAEQDEDGLMDHAYDFEKKLFVKNLDTREEKTVMVEVEYVQPIFSAHEVGE